jgi:hypothetical protein
MREHVRLATAALRTLCVHPGPRARGLGTNVSKEYIERMGKIKAITRVVIHHELVPFYER